MDYITDRDTYLKMKADQKAVVSVARKFKIDYKNWQRDKSLGYPKFLFPIDPRYLNIVYGLVKGRTYIQIEQKVREGNEPNSYGLDKVCRHYGIDSDLIVGMVLNGKASNCA